MDKVGFDLKLMQKTKILIVSQPAPKGQGFAKDHSTECLNSNSKLLNLGAIYKKKASNSFKRSMNLWF